MRKFSFFSRKDSQSKTPINHSRIYWIDICKAYGMILVFYGHIWLASSIPNNYALLQNKFIYSFHMPLFFMLSGFFANVNTQKFDLFFKNKIFTRLVPVLVFNVLLFICELLLSIIAHTFSFKDYLEQLTNLIRGQASLNVPTWFLVCLFTTELIHFYISRKITSQKGRLISVIVFYALGIIVTRKMSLVSHITGIAPNFWYIHESLIAYSFFLLGFILNQSKILEKIKQSPVKYFYLILTAIVLLATFNLNKGLYSRDGDFTVVLMVSSMHGHPIWFLVTALAGSFALIFLSQVTPKNRILLFLGENTLVLLGLNGFFRNIFNPMIVKSLPPEAFNGHYRLILVGSLVTIVSLIACVPGILFFNKFFPQVIGRPKEKGPVLPNLI